MKELQITARLQIHDGQLEAFKAAAAACIKSVQEKDTGTLQYDWFFNADQTECHVCERYRDSDALLEHIGNLGDIFGQLLAVSDFSAEMYGTPSAELIAATEGVETTVYSFYQSM